MRVWVWTAATAVLVVVAALLWRGSDAAATESTTAASARLPAGTPGAELTEAWSLDTRPLPRTPVQGGRVIVGQDDGVRGLDPTTGDEAWHYTRSNARLCDLTAIDGRAIAIFATADRCDEAVALDAGTGVRLWTRNLGLRSDITLRSATGMVLATAPSGVVVLDPGSDTLRWRAAASSDCRIEAGDVGGSGVVLLERCDDALRLRVLETGQGDELWTQDLALPTDGEAVELAGAGRLVTVVVGGELRTFRGSGGTPLAITPAPVEDGPADDAVPAQATESGDSTLVHVRGRLAVLDAQTGQLRWSVSASGLPASAFGAEPAAATPTLLVPEGDAFVSRDLGTGAELGRSTVDDVVPAGGRTAVVGSVVIYRLVDRVTGYR